MRILCAATFCVSHGAPRKRADLQQATQFPLQNLQALFKDDTFLGQGSDIKTWCFLLEILLCLKAGSSVSECSFPDLDAMGESGAIGHLVSRYGLIWLRACVFAE